MGSPQVINCTVSTVSGVESSLVMISWMGPGGSITTTNGRVSIRSVTDDGNNMFTSSLQFTYLMEGDEGTYTCNVMILDTSGSQSVELQSLTGNELKCFTIIIIASIFMLGLGGIAILVLDISDRKKPRYYYLSRFLQKPVN